MKPYEFHPEAENEYYDSIRYYTKISKRTGLNFIEEFEKTLRIIRQFPEIGVQEDEDVRKFGFKIFPYSIVYSNDKTQIFIAAVAPHRKEERYWKKRV